MTAPRITMKITHTSTPTVALFALAGASTILAVLHVIAAAQHNWPPQLMTLHAAAALGFWIAAFRLQDRSREAAPPAQPAIAPSAPPTEYVDVDSLGKVVHPLDQLELDDLEWRLRDTDW